MYIHDVVVIGAGPAGSAAAILCAQQGLSVALLEQSAVYRDRPGETLPPGIEPLLQQLAIAPALSTGDFIRHHGNWVQWGTPRHFNAFGGDADGPWRGFQIPRRLLDNRLLSQAQAVGAAVVRPCRALKVIRSNETVIGVDTDQGVFHCAQLIDASGAKGWLARQLALERHAYSPPLIATYGYAKGRSTVCDDAPAIIANPHGWYWIAKIAADSYAWTRLKFNARQANLQPPAELAHLRDFSNTRGADVTWRACGQCAGAGYFMVGDAASILDPGTSHGVLKAIMSGMMAGHAVIKSLAHPVHQATYQHQYRTWLNSWFVRDMNKMREFYTAHPAPPDWLTTAPIIHFDTLDLSGI
ncbi:flavin-dependent dehydrogenase [Pseudomonas sp. WPR_5_2]|uniref:NAD(P)/FAD-dependent oxidoreductase n=1 Tax=Pseudomonas sp. WPR_5_2 TaxID=1907371 RepID=UPI000EB28A45|nr:tryptophan 7-halogenase [Pseudomonas sp. WPR_5_2]RKS17148.1 flavin-dependent dehydrogenase [Pseudomonas sp. WPR_5_2]